MRPHFRLLSEDVINQIINEGLALLMDPGVRVENAEALELLADAGCDVDLEAQVARIPEEIVRTCAGYLAHPLGFHVRKAPKSGIMLCNRQCIWSQSPHDNKHPQFV